MAQTGGCWELKRKWIQHLSLSYPPSPTKICFSEEIVKLTEEEQRLSEQRVGRPHVEQRTSTLLHHDPVLTGATPYVRSTAEGIEEGIDWSVWRHMSYGSDTCSTCTIKHRSSSIRPVLSRTTSDAPRHQWQTIFELKRIKKRTIQTRSRTVDRSAHLRSLTPSAPIGQSTLNNKLW